MSKSAKNIKQSKSGSVPHKPPIKRIQSGSKTSKPMKAAQKPKTNTKVQPESTIDINKIFDIIESEAKRKEKQNQKERAIEEAVNSIDKKSSTKPSIKPAPKLISKVPVKNDNNTINTIIEKPDKSLRKKSSKDEDILSEANSPVSKQVVDSYLEAKKFLKDHGVVISTITLDCKLHTLIDVDKFAKNVVLREDEIVSVKFGNRKDSATNRTIVIIKGKKKPSVRNFYNQVTILMKPMNNPSRNYINIKVFKNGSLQMTGCKDMDDFNNVATTLINILKRGQYIKNKKGEDVHIKFIDRPKKIGIFDVKIRMINSNFKLDYKVDRKKLAKLLKKNHKLNTKDEEIGYVECKYEPTGGHSCVNIKYSYDAESKPSIFVFQTGAIIITGAKNLHHIIMAYHYIHKILNKYYDEIRIIDLDQDEVQAEIAKFFKDSNKKKIISPRAKNIANATI